MTSITLTSTFSILTLLNINITIQKQKASIFKSGTINPQKSEVLDIATSARCLPLVSASASIVLQQSNRTDTSFKQLVDSR